MIYTLQNLSVLGLCLRTHDSGMFSWISQTALSQIYFIIAAMQDGPSMHIEEPQPTPYQKAQFYSPILFLNYFGLLPCLQAPGTICKQKHNLSIPQLPYFNNVTGIGKHINHR